MAARAPLRIRLATKEDVPLILTFIRELAQHERALDRVSATEEALRVTLFAQKAINRNCARMEWSVLNWNEPAIRFYERLFAEPVHDWTVFRLSKEKMGQLAAQTGQ